MGRSSCHVRRVAPSRAQADHHAGGRRCTLVQDASAVNLSESPTVACSFIRTDVVSSRMVSVPDPTVVGRIHE